MQYKSLLPVALTTVTAFLAGCSNGSQDLPSNTTEISEMRAQTRTPGSNNQENAPSRIRGQDAMFLKMANELPGFGGYSIGKDGRFKVLLTRGKDTPRLRGLIQRSLVARHSDKRAGGRKINLDPSSFEYQPIAYTIQQIMSWREIVSVKLLDHRVIGGVGYNETNGLITVGLHDLSDQAQVLRQLVALRIPSDVVEFIQTPKLTVSGTLTDYAPRPTPTGYAFRTNGAGGEYCTMGFNAELQGVYGFFSAGHCGTGYNGDQMSINRDAYQPDLGTTSIARLTVNPTLFACENTYGCRSSDAAFYRYHNQTNKSNFTKIAKTADIGYAGYAGSTTVVGNFNVIGRRDYPNLYDPMEKVGYVTGWTGGEFVLTCYDAVSQDDPTTPQIEDQSTKVCSDYYTGATQSGDSGGPVFERFDSTSINILGIAFARAEYSDGRIGGAMSAISNIDSDFGYVDVLPY